MSHGSFSLRETAAPTQHGAAHVPQMGRRGQYQVDKLLERYGADISMPDLRHELAQCPRCHDTADPCCVEYIDPRADLTIIEDTITCRSTSSMPIKILLDFRCADIRVRSRCGASLIVEMLIEL
jgi:hypothetical protein